jgi:polar amino acid transport system substrate-binding protein
MVEMVRADRRAGRSPARIALPLAPRLLLFAAALLASPGSLQAAPSAVERIRARGQLTYAGDLQGGEPYVFRDPRDPSRLMGFEVELAEALARQLGVKAVFTQNDWNNLVPSLERGDFDIAMNGLEDSQALRDRALVSHGYAGFREQLVVRTGSPMRTLESLHGQRVGTLGQSLAPQLLRHQPVTLKLYEGQDEPYSDLLNGRLEAVLLDSVIATHYGLTKPGLELADPDLGRGTYVIAVRKSEPDLRDALNQGLGELRANGQLAAILAKWKIEDASIAGGAIGLSPPGGAAGESAGVGTSQSPTSKVQSPPSDTEVPQTRFDRAQLWLFVRGALITLFVTFLAMALAAPLGLLLALMRLYGSAPLRFLSNTYVEMLRGTPVLLQLYLLYYGLAPIIHLNALTAAVLGLGLNYGAYEAEVHRAAIGAVPLGQGEAASALGMSRLMALRLVILPQSLRWALPAMTNDLIALLKDSSLISVITVVELTKQMTITAVDVRSWALPGLVCAGFYFAMSWPLGRLAMWLEERLAQAGEESVTGVDTVAVPTLATQTIAPPESAAVPQPVPQGIRIKTVGLEKNYGARLVLAGIDAQVAAGETIALVGPSGGGKSTFLRCLNGLHPFNRGKLEVAGLDIPPGTKPESALLRPLRVRVGMVFQGFHLFPHLSALENICLGPLAVKGESRSVVEERALALLGKVGLRDRAHALPAMLSGGQQQRVAIARALAMLPEVLLLDEPTSALDPQMRGEVLAVLRDLAKEGKTTMLVVTHEMAFARAVASRVWVFDNGKLVEDGPPGEVCENPQSERARAFFGTSGATSPPR